MKLGSPDGWGTIGHGCASADYECAHGNLPNQYGPACTARCWHSPADGGSSWGTPGGRPPRQTTPSLLDAMRHDPRHAISNELVLAAWLLHRDHGRSIYSLAVELLPHSTAKNAASLRVILLNRFKREGWQTRTQRAAVALSNIQRGRTAP